MSEPVFVVQVEDNQSKSRDLEVELKARDECSFAGEFIVEVQGIETIVAITQIEHTN